MTRNTRLKRKIDDGKKNTTDLWVYAEKDFTKSLEAISVVEKLLSCTSCEVVMDKPVTLWSCDHLFCQSCVEGMDKCTVCSLPAWAEDQRENKTITNIARLCKALKELLESYMNETRQIATVNEETETEAQPQTSNKECLKGEGTMGKSTVIIEVNKEAELKAIKTPRRYKRKSTNSMTLQDVSNTKDLEFSTPSPAKRKKISNLGIYVTPRYSKRRTSSLGRSPVGRTPKSVKKNKRGETALHIAAIKGNLPKIEELIAEGAVEINAKDNAGWTPLHEACNHGHYSVAEALLDAGAIVNIPGYENQTPLLDALSNGHHDIVKLLLERGADPWIRDVDGNTALSLAANNRSITDMIEKFSTLDQAKSSAASQSEEMPDFAPQEIVLSYSSSVSSANVRKCGEILKARIDADTAAQATHLIVGSYADGRCPRTFKYLQSVARGAWVVQCDWLEACTVTGTWVNEHSFEISASRDDIMSGGPKRSRMNKASQFPGIFHGCHFYLSGSFKPPCLSKAQLSEIVQLAGGVILTREPKPDSDSVQSCTKVPYHAESRSAQYYYSYYIVYDSVQGKPSRMVRRGKVCTVPVSWLLGCVSQFFLSEIPE